MDLRELQKEYKVHVYETGPDGRVNLNFIMNHLPSSVEINYLAESMFNEEIVIRTSKEEGNRELFNHSVIRLTDNRDLCRVKIEWNESNSRKN